jgi:hypothetical protein
MSRAMPRSFTVSRHRAALLACIGVLVIGGCSRYVEDKWSRARPRTYPVRGIVQQEGQPIGGAVVTFLGRSGSGDELAAVGLTEASGRFELKTFRPGDGAIAGSHRVTIEKRSLQGGESDAEKPFATQQEYEARRAAAGFRPKIVRELPAKYGSFDTSGLTAEVTEKGPNEFVFTLEDSETGPK